MRSTDIPDRLLAPISFRNDRHNLLFRESALLHLLALPFKPILYL